MRLLTEEVEEHQVSNDAETFACFLKLYLGTILFLLFKALQISTRSLVYLVRNMDHSLNHNAFVLSCIYANDFICKMGTLVLSLVF